MFDENDFESFTKFQKAKVVATVCTLRNYCLITV